ncbi:MAG TPA: hypothetical protein VNV38_10125 [Stellaceae bacterium]|jgi:hypothetical protein|nr:hypothetical protein [Stellaceae bacterium]
MAEDGGKRRSNVVTLTVLGLFASVVVVDKAIPQPTEMRRNVYTNQADCERDYSQSQCQQDSGRSSGTGGSAYHAGYHGPYYSASRSTTSSDDPGPGRTGATRVSYETSYRGGFGAFGRAIHGVA